MKNNAFHKKKKIIIISILQIKNKKSSVRKNKTMGEEIIEENQLESYGKVLADLINLTKLPLNLQDRSLEKLRN